MFLGGDHDCFVLLPSEGSKTTPDVMVVVERKKAKKATTNRKVRDMSDVAMNASRA